MHPEENITGIHHITAIASSAAENLAFYQNILGLRLVKQTINFDDPFTYHLYYGDAQGAPGTILTFFPWENMPQGKPGAGMVTAVAFAIPRRSVDFWMQRIHATGTPTCTGKRFGDSVIQLRDPSGLPIELIGSSEPPPHNGRHQSAIPEIHAISGFHSATATMHSLEQIRALLVDVMGMTMHGQEDKRYRFMMADHEAPGHYYDVLIDTNVSPGTPGGGTVHHIAFRTGSDRAQALWQSRLRQKGLSVTGVRDRKYFRSIYFHAPGGILFEIATDPPGFAVDESIEKMGSALKLPDQYESIRSDIENRLPPLHSTPFHHVFKNAQDRTADNRTIVSLHGTGGNEHDLIRFAESVAPTSAIISPRGRVLENGMPRFFRRLSNNIFDEEDVVRRAHELSDFLLETAVRFERKRTGMTAFGYSNGANIAAAILLLRPEVFASAILLRPMLPLQELLLPDLQNKGVLILRGAQDVVIPADNTDQLIEMLQQAGADVTTRTMDAGHEITKRDMDIISRWLSERPITDAHHVHAVPVQPNDPPHVSMP